LSQDGVTTTPNNSFNAFRAKPIARRPATYISLFLLVQEERKDNLMFKLLAGLLALLALVVAPATTLTANTPTPTTLADGHGGAYGTGKG
jgi:hypothetical protein